MNVHQAVSTGFTDGRSYDAYRPSFTDELVNHVVESLHTCDKGNPDVQYDVLELGSGTGKFTRKLAPKLSEKGLRYLVTEPMKEFLETLMAKSPDVEAKVCTASNIPLPNSSVQNIVCSQCIHWFTNQESLQEMKRVLTPGGRIFIAYNNKEWEASSWMSELKLVYEDYMRDVPSAASKQWKQLLDSDPALTLVEYSILPGIKDFQYDKETMVKHFLSISVIAALDDEKKEVARSRFREIFDKYFPDKKQIVCMPFHSELYCTKKI